MLVLSNVHTVDILLSNMSTAANVPKMSQQGGDLSDAGKLHRRSKSQPHSAAKGQHTGLSESWPRFSGNALTYVGFRACLYDRMHSTRGKYLLGSLSRRIGTTLS